jgi:acyl carrier protein
MGRTDEKGDVQLVAYVVADASADHTTQSLRSALEQTLPAYMIPTLFVRLDSMPQTLTGKVDRRALPAPGDRETPVETSEPSGNVQEGLAAIWRDALELDRIGVDEHFLDLGGDSLKAMTIVARVVRTFELGLPHGELLGPLLEAGTIAEMAMIVEALSEDLPADPVQQSAQAEGPG